jgi:putative transcriptional regulator
MTRPRADADAGDSWADQEPAIGVHLDELLSWRGMTLTELSARVDVTIANLSILKNGRARAIRFSTLARLCEALDCQPGDLLSFQPRPEERPDQAEPVTNYRPARPVPAAERDR